MGRVGGVRRVGGMVVVALALAGCGGGLEADIDSPPRLFVEVAGERLPLQARSWQARDGASSSGSATGDLLRPVEYLQAPVGGELELLLFDARGLGGQVQLLELGCGFGAEPRLAEVGGVVVESRMQGDRGTIGLDVEPGLYLVSVQLRWAASNGVSGSVSAVAAIRAADGGGGEILDVDEIGC